MRENQRYREELQRIVTTRLLCRLRCSDRSPSYAGDLNLPRREKKLRGTATGLACTANPRNGIRHEGYDNQV